MGFCFCFCFCFCLRFGLGRYPACCKAALHESVFAGFWVVCFREFGSLGVWVFGCSGVEAPRVKTGQWGAYDSTMLGYLANTFAASAHPSTVSSRGRPPQSVIRARLNQVFANDLLSFLTSHLYDMFPGGRLPESHAAPSNRSVLALVCQQESRHNSMLPQWYTGYSVC